MDMKRRCNSPKRVAYKDYGEEELKCVLHGMSMKYLRNGL